MSSTSEPSSIKGRCPPQPICVNTTTFFRELRIGFSMAEEQQRQAGRVQEQNHAETMVLLQGGLQIAQRGQWTALIISFCVMIAIIILIVLDKMDATSFGVAAVLGALATLVGRFLWDFSKRRARPDDGEIQAADLPEPLAQPNQQTLNR